MSDKVVVDEGSVPRFPRHVKFNFNKQRQQWVVLAPERLLVPDETSVEVLKLCDGTASVGAIVATLIERYNAPPDVIRKDVLELLQGLADKGFIVT
jgi:pyrroloquinoline quinone biosynthesis protein D